MKNAAPQIFFTSEIQNQKPDAKVFYKFIGTFEQLTSPNQAIINTHIRMTLVKQPPQQDLKALKPKDKILLFAQVVEENKHIEGQIRKVTLQQALKFENLMKKQKHKSFENVNMIGGQNKMVDEEDEKKTKTIIFGQRNGGFYQHF